MWFFSLGFSLLCTKDAVAGVAETRNDVFLIIQTLIHDAAVNIDIRMILDERGGALR